MAAAPLPLTGTPEARAAGAIVGTGTVHAGFYSSQWESTDDIDAMAAWAGRRPTFVGTFHHIYESEGTWWSQNTAWVLEQAWQAQGTPVASLGIDHSAYSIARGDHDADIVKWANRLKAWLETPGGPPRNVFIAPLQEQNGDWTPWGCDPENFKTAFARIRSLILGVGIDSTQVRWVWAPNGWTSDVGACNGKFLADYYPGPSLVDVIGYSAYRWSGESVYNSVGGVADELRAIDPNKPYLVLQTAAGPTADRDQWIRDLFVWAANDPNVVGVVWFNFLDVQDFRVWASPTGPGLAPGWKDALSGSFTTHTWPLTDWFQGGTLPFSPVGEGMLAERFAGSSRYTTAIAVSRETFAPGVPVAYVATGLAFPDALAAAAAAGAQGGPVLLVPGTTISGATLDELKRLDPKRIVVVGGEAAVSDDVVGALMGVAPTVRLGGSNRFSTAALIADDAFDAGVPIAYVATGRDFPDALAAAAAAGAQGGPVLLSEKDSLPAATRNALISLQPEEIVVVGGTNAIGTAVEAELATLASTRRVAGTNRYDTAAKLADFVSAPSTVFVATGLSFPDALAGAAAAGALGVPLLLTQPDAVPGPTSLALRSLSPDKVVVLGGTSVIGDYVSMLLRQAAGY